MVDLIGNSTCKLDDKLRITLPSKLIKQLDGEPDMSAFIVKPSLDLPCIELYPKSNWDIKLSQLKRLDRLRPESNMYLLQFLRNHQLIHLDKSNRLLMPGGFIESANIKKDIVLATIIDVIQVWDSETYDKYTKTLPANFHQVAEKALSNNNE